MNVGFTEEADQSRSIGKNGTLAKETVQLFLPQVLLLHIKVPPVEGSLFEPIFTS